MRLVEDDDRFGEVDLGQGPRADVGIEQVVVREEDNLRLLDVAPGQVEGTYLPLGAQSLELLQIEDGLVGGGGGTAAVSPTRAGLIVGHCKALEVVLEAALALLGKLAAACIDIGGRGTLGLDAGMDAQLLPAAEDGVLGPIPRGAHFTDHLRQLRVRPAGVQDD